MVAESLLGRLPAVTLWTFCLATAAWPARLCADESAASIPRVAAVVTAYYHNSHADMFVSRLVQGMTLDNQGAYPKLKLASLYLDQTAPNDIGRALMAKHNVPIYKTVREALTLGGDKLAVDGVLLIAEHGVYPLLPDGQIAYPKRRLFGEVAQVFETSGRSAPVFFDKHFSDNWEDATWIYDTARRLKTPLLAGSALPIVWREPLADVRRDDRLTQIVVLSFGPLEGYGFHGLEVAQALAERRRGGETGVKRVQCIEGRGAWDAGRAGVYDRALLALALKNQKNHPQPGLDQVEQKFPTPSLFVIDYEDGLRVSMLSIEHLYLDWSAAWRSADGTVGASCFWTQEARPLMHFAHLTEYIQSLMITRESPWPVERTLLTTGILDAAFASRSTGKAVDTPHLRIRYQSKFEFRPPPPPPPGRPLEGP